MRFIFTFMVPLLLLTGCGQESGNSTAENPSGPAAASVADRWYAASQVERGAQIFASQCAVCHGDRAQGLTEDWRQRLPDGNFPAPPLNGSAHAWHHPLAQLSQIIDTGGEPYGGQMPPFAEVLDEEEKLAAIAYFQSFWDEDTYLSWLDRGGLQ